jgi:hypothetical protein
MPGVSGFPRSLPKFRHSLLLSAVPVFDHSCVAIATEKHACSGVKNRTQGSVYSVQCASIIPQAGFRCRFIFFIALVNDVCMSHVRVTPLFSSSCK